MFAFMTLSADAAILDFTPSSSNLWNLNHGEYYEWGINWEIPAGEYIQETVLTFANIDNWKNEENILYVHLLDSISAGTYKFADRQGGGDNFSGQGILIGTYSDKSQQKSNKSYLYIQLAKSFG